MNVTSTAAAVLAVLGPLMVGGLATMRGSPAEAGHSDFWTGMRAELERGGGDVVLLGNSTSHSDIERVTLAHALGVQTLTNPLLPGSGAAGWLAVLEGQVAAADLHPRLVLVYGTLETLLGWRSPPGHVSQVIDELIADRDTHVGRRVYGEGRDTPYAKLAANWSGAQSELVDGLRDRAIGAVFPVGEGGTLAERGASVARPALDALFGDPTELRGASVARVLPVQEASGELSFSTTRPAMESLVPDLVAVAHGLGARVVFIRGPDAPTRKPTAELAAEAEPLRRLIDALGAGYADVSDAPVSPANYHDTVHMNAENRSVLTAALIEELARIDPLHAVTMPLSRKPLRLLASRRVGSAPSPELGLTAAGECRWSGALENAEITNPALVGIGLGAASPLRLSVREAAVSLGSAALPEGCALGAQVRAGRVTLSASADLDPGAVTLDLDPALPLLPGTNDETWWVFPGTRVDFDLDVEEAATLKFALRALKNARVVVRVGDREVPLTAQGNLLDGQLDVPATGAVTVTVEATGGYAVLEAVQAARDGRSRTLLGGFDDRVALRHGWAGDPLPWPEPTPTRDGDVDVYDLPALAGVADDVLTTAGLPGCSVLDVRAAGNILAHRAAATRDSRGARVSFLGGILRVPVGLEPITLALRGPRACDPVTWVYPGEERTSQTPLVDLARLRAGAVALELVAEAWPPGPGSVRLRFGTTRETFLDVEVPLFQLDGTPVRLLLPERQVGLLRHAQVTVNNPGSGFVLVRGVSVTP